MTTVTGRAKMRKKTVTQRSILDQAIDTLPALIKPDPELKRINTVTRQNPQIVELVHQDLIRDVSADTGANGMSSEQVLRIAIVRQLRKYSWRELARRLNDGIWLRWFGRLFTGKVSHYTALQKVVKAISEETWGAIHQTLIAFAKERKIERSSAIKCFLPRANQA